MAARTRDLRVVFFIVLAATSASRMKCQDIDREGIPLVSMAGDPLLMDVLLHPEFFPLPEPGRINYVRVREPMALSGTYTTSTKFINECPVPSDCPVTCNSTVTLKGAFFVFNNIHVIGPGPLDGVPIQIVGNTYVEIVNSSFTGLQGFGAIVADGVNVNVTIYNSVFEGNTCAVLQKECAGALYGSSGASLYLFDTVFRNNTALGEGGALHMDTGTKAYSTRVTFANNSVIEAVSAQGYRKPINPGDSKRGGAVAIHGASAYAVFYECLFLGNSAPEKGGAVALWDFAESLFVECRFASNSAWYGGAFFAGTEANPGIVVRTQAWFYSTDFHANYVVRPSPLYIAAMEEPAELGDFDDYSDPVNNGEETAQAKMSSGAAVLALAAKVFATNCTFMHHYSENRHSENRHLGTVSVKSSSFEEDGLLNLYNVTFFNNSALLGGCVHAETRATVSAVNARFDSCRALRSGGALYIADRSLLHLGAATCVNSTAGILIALESMRDPDSNTVASLLAEQAGSTQDSYGGCIFARGNSNVTVSPVVNKGMASLQQQSSMLDELVVGTAYEPEDVHRQLEGLFSTFGDFGTMPSVFDSCDAYSGGAISALRSRVSVSGAVFAGVGNHSVLPSTRFGGTAIHSVGTQMYITRSEFYDGGLASTVYTDGGYFLITNSMLADSSYATGTQELDPLLQDPVIVVESGPATLGDIVFRSEESQRVMLGTPQLNARNVYANATQVPLRDPELATFDGWATCFTLAVAGTYDGRNTSCGYILSAISDISIVTSTKAVGIPVVVPLKTPGQFSDCSVESADETYILDLGENLLNKYICSAQDVPEPPMSNITTALIVCIAVAFTTFVFVLVMLVFYLTPGEAILENTMYKENLIKLKTEKPDEFLVALSSLNESLGRAGTAVYGAWCKAVLTVAYCLMCMWSEMRAKDKMKRLASKKRPGKR